MIRKLNISFNEDLSVEYYFRRDVNPLRVYTIEHPANEVEILSADIDYTTSLTNEGWLRLEWGNYNKGGWSHVRYKKKQMLKVSADSVGVFTFSESIRINGPNFGLWLGSPCGELNALKNCSTAVFKTVGGSIKRYKPCELSEHVFSTKGVLEINWLLESTKR